MTKSAVATSPPEGSTAEVTPPKVNPVRALAGGVTLPLLLLGAVALSLAVGAGSFEGGDISALLHSRGDRTAVGIVEIGRAHV